MINYINSEISECYLGNNKLDSVYLGSNKLWPTAFDYSQEYFTIESLKNNNTIIWQFSTSSGTPKTIQWSNDMLSWTSVTSSYSGTTITTLNTGDKIYIKGSNDNYSMYTSIYNYFNSDDKFNISGNIMSLIYGDNFIGQITLPSVSQNFANIFKRSKVVDASNLILPATTLTNYCYYHMFYGCTSLTTAPELTATTLANYCYSNMFEGCTSLTTAPKLPATTLSSYCYRNMFYGCKSLRYIKCLATDISASSSHTNWVSNVAATGTFVKSSSMTSWGTGSSGIPIGWTVVNV